MFSRRVFVYYRKIDIDTDIGICIGIGIGIGIGKHIQTEKQGGAKCDCGHHLDLSKSLCSDHENKKLDKVISKLPHYICLNTNTWSICKEPLEKQGTLPNMGPAVQFSAFA